MLILLSGNFTDIDVCMCPANNYTGGKCQPGTYCPSGSSAPVLCIGGQYCEDYELALPNGQSITIMRMRVPHRNNHMQAVLIHMLNRILWQYMSCSIVI